MILSVPFRNQSETLTNLKEALSPGQLLIDATVPLAAAVSGKATRMLGVWQGSAAQQAQEMVPEGVRVVSALHTVSAASLSRSRASARAGRARVRRRPRGQARGGGADRADQGLRCVDCGRLEMARMTEALTALLIAVNARYKAHAGIRLTRASRPAVGVTLGTSDVVVLSGGTGGAKLVRGLPEVVDPPASR